MEIRKIIALFIAMHVTVVCYSQARIQSRDVKRESGKVYLLSNGKKYEICEKVVLAKLKDGKRQVRDDIKVKETHCLGFLEIAVPDSITVEQYVKVLDETNDFEFVEFNTYAKPCMYANDSLYYAQWGLGHIHADAAWEITTGSPSVKVAIIDIERVQKSHPDLSYGSDTYSNLSVSEGYDCDTDLPSCHGTMVAGIIAAKTNNGTGIAGIAGGNHSEGSKLIPYCANNMLRISNAIYDAVYRGAKIINMSLDSPNSSMMEQAITSAYNNGVTIVCASGNSFNSSIVFPASHEHTIAVGAINSSHIRAPSSNYGNGLDLVAPGVDIISTAPADSGYYRMSSGTSYAAPHVSGVVALMLSVNPTLTPAQIREILHDSCTKLSDYTYDGNGWNSEVGYGLLNAENAVKGTVIYSMSGPSIICNSTSATYTIDNLPSSYSVSWSINNNNFTITPSGNQCYVIYSGSPAYSVANLTADIKWNEHVLKSISKRIIMHDPELFVQGYQPESYVPDGYCPEQYFTVSDDDLSLRSFNHQSMDTLFFAEDESLPIDFVEESVSGIISELGVPNIYGGNNVTLTSTRFDGMDISFSGTTSPEYYNRSGNSIVFRMPTNIDTYSVTVNGSSDSGCHDFSFRLNVIPPHGMTSNDPNIILSLSGTTLSITFEGDIYFAGHGQIGYCPWNVAIYEVPSAGTPVYSAAVPSNQTTINVNTSSWSPGYYLIRVTQNGNVYTKKIFY